jgi:hypothetical protein
MGLAWSKEAQNEGSKERVCARGEQLEAAGGIEPPYGALQELIRSLW